jgi:hypothetical protein
MQNFFYNGYFISDLEDFIEELGLDEEDISDLPDDWEEECQESKLEKIFVLKEKFILDNIMSATEVWEDRFPEESDRTFKEIEKTILQSIDVEKLNSLLPEIYYPNGKKFKVTKNDLLEFIK